MAQFYYKKGQVLQSEGSFIRKWGRYYKVWQLLQRRAVYLEEVVSSPLYFMK